MSILHLHPTSTGQLGSTRSRVDSYRPDIDGLRAVAVVSVILYHLRNEWLPGGYVGVDVFFVISGFLITRNIWDEMRAGRFSLGAFYLRRIRRIAPASLLVTLATVCASALLLQPGDMERLARSAIWSSLSAANVFFWKYLDTDYFAESSDQEPLLHMWSLGVEEQFYLLWPALLMLLAMAGKRRKIMFAATIAIGIGAFVVAERTNVDAPKFSYFMLPARAGELMMGAVIALSGRHSAQMDATTVRRWSGDVLAMCGLGLLGFSLWGLDDTKPFPGINALYPCLGTASLIVAGQMRSTIVNALLTSKPVVFVGLISYSLYLWHWPILAFIRYFHGDISPAHAAIAAVAMSMLSVASYRWIEQPARRMRGKAWMQATVLLVVPALAVVSIGSFVIRTDGLKSMVEASVGQGALDNFRRQTEAVGKDDYPCQASRPTRDMLAGKGCVVGEPATGSLPDVVLWGDSNAGHYIGVLKEVAESGGFPFRYLAVPTCPPVFGRGAFGASYSRETCQHARDGFRRALGQSPAKVVVLAGQWSVHDRNRVFSDALQNTIVDLRAKGASVVVLAQVPLFPNYSRECEARWTRFDDGNCAVRATTPDGGSSINRKVERIAKESGAIFLDVRRVLCRNGHCSPYLEGQPVYFNQSHLSREGSVLIGKAVRDSEDYPAWLSALAPPARLAADDAKQPLPIPAPAMTDSVRLSLPAGYQPTFHYSLRSQRHEPAGRGRYRHVVILEYIDPLDAADLATKIVNGFSANGLAMEGPIQHGAAIRYVGRGRNLYLTVDVRPDPESLVLRTIGARGIVYFGWKDTHAPSEHD